MPRVSSSAKRQQGAASNRDSASRHDNGLVGPGKRVSKQRSQSQVDGVPRPSAPDLAKLDNANGHLSSPGRGPAQPGPSSTANGNAKANGNGLATRQHAQQYHETAPPVPTVLAAAAAAANGSADHKTAASLHAAKGE